MINTKGVMSHTPMVQPTEHPRTSPSGSRGQNTCLDIPLAGVCRGALSHKQWRLALSKLEKLMKLDNSRIRLVAWADVSCFADQLMTPYCSGGSTINGTPGGDT